MYCIYTHLKLSVIILAFKYQTYFKELQRIEIVLLYLLLYLPFLLLFLHSQCCRHLVGVSLLSEEVPLTILLEQIYLQEILIV